MSANDDSEYPIEDRGLVDVSDLRRERAELLKALGEVISLIDEANDRPTGDNGICDADGALTRARELLSRLQPVTVRGVTGGS